MNKKTNLNHEKIKHLLNRSVIRLEQPVLARLRNAQDLALLRYEARRASPTFAWAGNFTDAGGTPQKIRFLAAAVLLAAILLGAASYWNQVADNDTSDVDIAILTDDLPMHVYID